MIIVFPNNLPSTPLRDRNRKRILAVLPDNIPRRSVIRKQGYPEIPQHTPHQLRSYDALLARKAREENRARLSKVGTRIVGTQRTRGVGSWPNPVNQSHLGTLPTSSRCHSLSEIPPTTGPKKREFI